MQNTLPNNVAFNKEQTVLNIIDQTRLPQECVVLSLATKEAVWDAIKRLAVRGAPAIGITAAFGLYIAVKDLKESGHDAFFEELESAKHYLASSRPTAVNLFWALERMANKAQQVKALPVPAIIETLYEEAETILQEDAAVCRAIGEHGLTLLKPGMTILTHCNAGWLATSRYGTALAPVYVGQEKGYGLKVFADETRPLLQGARLTAFELSQAGVDVTLICDNMASIVMKQGWVDAVFTGCDRVAANGDAANKIGTSGVAILAKHYGIPFYICAPTSTIDFQCPQGKDIPIELREGSEITDLWYETPMAPAGVKTYNPAFDVTDHGLITAFVTERGVFAPDQLHFIQEVV